MNLNEKIKYIEDYKIPNQIIERVKKEYNYTDYHVSLLIDGLKDYFIAHALRGTRTDFLTMASYHIDQLWHWFILYTPDYRSFCDKVYGKYLDHIPTVGVVPTKTHKDDSYFNTLNYLKKIKEFRVYQTNDLQKLNEIDEFYSIFAIDYIINGESFEKAILKSNDDMDLI